MFKNPFIKSAFTIGAPLQQPRPQGKTPTQSSVIKFQGPKGLGQVYPSRRRRYPPSGGYYTGGLDVDENNMGSGGLPKVDATNNPTLQQGTPQEPSWNMEGHSSVGTPTPPEDILTNHFYNNYYKPYIEQFPEDERTLATQYFNRDIKPYLMNWAKKHTDEEIDAQMQKLWNKRRATLPQLNKQYQPVKNPVNSGTPAQSIKGASYRNKIASVIKIAKQLKRKPDYKSYFNKYSLNKIACVKTVLSTAIRNSNIEAVNKLRKNTLLKCAEYHFKFKTPFIKKAGPFNDPVMVGDEGGVPAHMLSPNADTTYSRGAVGPSPDYVQRRQQIIDQHEEKLREEEIFRKYNEDREKERQELLREHPERDYSDPANREALQKRIQSGTASPQDHMDWIVLQSEIQGRFAAEDPKTYQEIQRRRDVRQQIRPNPNIATAGVNFIAPPEDSSLETIGSWKALVNDPANYDSSGHLSDVGRSRQKRYGLLSSKPKPPTYTPEGYLSYGGSIFSPENIRQHAAMLHIDIPTTENGTPIDPRRLALNPSAIEAVNGDRRVTELSKDSVLPYVFGVPSAIAGGTGTLFLANKHVPPWAKFINLPAAIAGGAYAGKTGGEWGNQISRWSNESTVNPSKTFFANMLTASQLVRDDLGLPPNHPYNPLMGSWEDYQDQNKTSTGGLKNPPRKPYTPQPQNAKLELIPLDDNMPVIPGYGAPSPADPGPSSPLSSGQNNPQPTPPPAYNIQQNSPPNTPRRPSGNSQPNPFKPYDYNSTNH